jgi:probable F420-dependent oxidoreductase
LIASGIDDHSDPHAMTLPVDVTFHGTHDRIAGFARRAQEHGVAGLFVAEAYDDPFISLTLAAAETTSLQLGTGVAIAFARTPMTMAYSAYHLHRVTGGRAILGLGSQIKPHVVYRYGMPWSRPAARMAEFVAAVRAVWHTWQTGEPLAFRGEFYRHTLMPPLFSPGPLGFASPPIWLAAVGPRMVDVAATAADGLLCHPLTSVGYLRDVLLPRVAPRRAADDSFTVAGMAMVATGRTESELANAIAATRAQIGFYASTPAYEPVLAHHGWSELHTEARTLTKTGRWAELPGLVDDEVLAAFAVVGEPAAARAALQERYAGLVDRVSLSMPYQPDEELTLALAR